MRKRDQKNLRVNAEVAKELSSIIRALKDPRIALMTSVTDAFVAPDLKTCKVYISVLDSDDARDETMAGLESARGFIRRELAARMNMRYTPELTFIADRSIERGVEMSRRIDEVLEHDRRASGQAEEP